jgi:hypothetical protein
MPRVVVLAEYRTSNARLLTLVRRAAAEDREAFTRLYDALLPEISAAVGGLVADPVRVDAVTSAAFGEAWSVAKSHTGPRTDVAAWITDIALRLAREQACPDSGLRLSIVEPAVAPARQAGPGPSSAPGRPSHR